jgi:hypothetical protein
MTYINLITNYSEHVLSAMLDIDEQVDWNKLIKFFNIEFGYCWINVYSLLSNLNIWIGNLMLFLGLKMSSCLMAG